MRRSRAVGLLVVGVLVGQLVPATLAADPETQELPPGTIVMIGEITAATDFGPVNFLTGYKTETAPENIEYLEYVHEVTENEFELLLFPDGLLAGEGDIVRNTITESRAHQPDGSYVDYRARFIMTVEVAIDAQWDGEEPGSVTGTFEMRAGALEVLVNELSSGKAGSIEPAPTVSGEFTGSWSSTTGQLEATLEPGDPSTYPGILTLEAVGVRVVSGAPGRGGLLLGKGPHGIDLSGFAEAFGNCKGEAKWREKAWMTPELQEWLAGRRPLLSPNEIDRELLGSGESICEIAMIHIWPLEYVLDATPPPSDLTAANIVALSHLLANAVSPADDELALFPSLGNPGVLRVLAVLGDKVKADPGNTAALTALVKFFNFNLRLNTACGPEECPA